MKFDEDLKSIDNKILVKAGEEINKALLDRLVRSAKNIHYLKIKDTIMAKDIKRAFKDQRYKIVFSNKLINRRMRSRIEQISLPQKIVAELIDMKKREPYTYHHVLIITLLGTKLALDKNLKNDYSPEMAARVGLIHDLGKSRIPVKILDKATPLTREEYEIIKMHPVIGYILLHYYFGREHSKYDYTSFEHHERLDGSGYPRKIKRIDRYAQLIAAVDVLDALISDRPYRETPYTLRAAFDVLILDEARRGRLNKKIVHLLLTYFRKDKPELRDLKVATKRRDKPPAHNVYGKIAPEK